MMNLDQELEVINEGREGSHSDPAYSTIVGLIYGDVSGVIADTLNCHHCLSSEDQREWMDALVHRYNMHAELLAVLQDLVGDSDDVDDGKLPSISSATVAIARQAIAKATGKADPRKTAEGLMVGFDRAIDAIKRA